MPARAAGFLVLVVGWVVVLGGVGLAVMRSFGPVAMQELWSDRGAAWMWPVSGGAVVLGLLLVWLGTRWSRYPPDSKRPPAT